MKFTDGDNRFRILDSPIAGYEYWVEEDGKKKPVRVHKESEADMSKINEKNKLRYFWALPVWNNAAGAVQVLEITQKTIMKEIQNLSHDEDWGDPKGYDIVVQKSGEGMDTEYSVMPKPAKEISAEAVRAWTEVLENGFDLDALFNNGNPFAKKEQPHSVKVEEEPLPEEEEISVEDIPF